jgi:transcriptional regulator with PAS, ATPase and Fis domain
MTELEAPARERRLVVPRVQVRVTAGPSKGQSIELSDASLLVGSSPECALVLDDESVSARHCELTRTGDGVVVRDLGSTNGVFVDDVRVTEAFPSAGAKIRVGRSTLQLKLLGQEELEVSSRDRLGTLYGDSPVMRALFARLEQYARSTAPLLIEGETGTGKDLAAEAVHHASPRKDGPFVIIDCGAVAGSLLEGELFGFEKGAFTGAEQGRPGMVEVADGGTLVIDEIGELPIELQPKLLRIVERREVKALGSQLPRKIDIRVIACTHRSLRSAVKAGTFREDLYFRLSALRVHIPPLRERTDDVPGLTDLLLAERGSSLRFKDLREGDRIMLRSHRWPGNVRELRNVVERLLATPAARAKELLDASGFTPAGGNEAKLPWTPARERALERFERSYLMELLAEDGIALAERARRAGISRQFLQRLLKKHGLDRE